MDYSSLSPANDFELNAWLTGHRLQNLGHNIELAISGRTAGTPMQKLSSLSTEQAQNLAVAVVPPDKTGLVVKLRTKIVALSSTQPEPEPAPPQPAPPQPDMCKYCGAKAAFTGHPYCGRRCAHKAETDGWVDGVPPTQPSVASLGQQPAMCKHCGVKPVYGGHPYCGKTCAGKAATAAAAAAATDLFRQFNKGGNMKRKHKNRKYTKRRSKKRKHKSKKRRSKKRKVNKTRRRRN